MLDIPKLIKEHHQDMVDKGFYSECPSCVLGYIMPKNKEDRKKPCKCCNDTGVRQDKNIGELLMLIVSELGEALEAHRNDRFSDKKDIEAMCHNIGVFDSGIWISTFESQIKDTFEDEIADVFLRLFDLCGYLGIEDLENFGLFGGLKNVAESLLMITTEVCILHQDYLISKKTKNLNSIYRELLWLCKELRIPIEKHIIAKMAYNKTRPHKHGKEY
jgi:NTP pyrophosphatase (non-canonical NTP hydrolase)